MVLFVALLLPVVAYKSVAVSPDGQWVAASRSDGVVALWDAKSAKRIGTVRAHVPVNSITFSPDSSTLAGGGDKQQVMLWRVDSSGLTSQWTRTVPAGFVSAVRFSPDGKTIACATASSDIVRFVDAGTGAWKSSLGYPGNGCSSLEYLSATRLLVGGQVCNEWDVTKAVPATSDEVQLNVIQASKPALVHRELLGWTSCVAVSPDRTWFIACGVRSRADEGYATTPVVFDSAKGSVIKQLDRMAKPIWAVAVSRDGSLCAIGGESGEVSVFATNDWKLLKTMRPGPLTVTALAFGNGDALAVVDDHGGAEVWDARQGARTRILASE